MIQLKFHELCCVYCRELVCCSNVAFGLGGLGFLLLAFLGLVFGCGLFGVFLLCFFCGGFLLLVVFVGCSPPPPKVKSIIVITAHCV